MYTSNRWSPPSELAIPVPRPVRSRTMVRGLQAAIVSLAALVILLTWFFAAGDNIKLSILRDRGIDTEAIVIKKYYHAKDTDEKNLEYHLDYRFRDAKAHVFDGTETVAYPIYFETGISDKVPVVYDPESPERAVLNFSDSLHRKNPWTILLIMTGIFMTFAAVLHGLVTYIFESYSRLQKHLLKWGTPAQATIVRTEAPRHGTEVTYTFVDRRGRTMTGAHSGLPTERDAEYRIFMKKISDNPCALYDPKDSTKNMLYPPVWAKIAKRN